jgi:carbon storage regulator CsrA
VLVLSRHVNECVVVTVAEIRGDKVRLGFSAPREIRVDRSEVRAAILRDAAARPATPERPARPPVPLPCGVCLGAGRRGDAECPQCRGSGTVLALAGAR